MHRKLAGVAVAVFFVITSFGFFVRPVRAASIVWNNAGGDNLWSNDANWVGGVKPGASDIATFNSTSTANATIDASFAGSVAGISIASTYSGIITQARSLTIGSSNYSQAAGTFTGATQDITLNGSYSLTGGTFNATSGNFTISGALTISSGTFNSLSGTVTSTGVASTWNINSSQTFTNLVINKDSAARMSLGAGDTFVITGALTLTQGGVAIGTIDTRGNITQAATFDSTASTTVIDFGDNAVAQTYTVNGGVTPSIRLDSASDASDSIVIAASATIKELRTAATFSGAIPLSNTSDFALTVTLWNQAAGTYDASAQTAWNIVTLTISGGTFTPPQTVTLTSVPSVWDINSSQTFNNLVVNKATGNITTLGSGDTIVITGSLTLTDGGLSIGTIDARGDVSVASTYDGGTSTLLFGGSSTQTFTLTGATGLYNGDITVNKSGGQVSLASALVLDASSQDLDIQEGTFNLAGNNLTVNGTSGTTVVEDGGTLKLYGSETTTLNASMPTLQSGSTVLFTGDGDSASDTYTVTTLKAAYHHLTINSTDGATDTFQLGSAIDMNGNFTLTAGTFDVSSSNYQMNVAGNWSNSGTFTARSGTVILDGTSQTLTGSTAFSGLTKSVSSAATLTFPAGTTTSVSGALALSGASGQLLSIRSSSTGVQANLASTGSRSLSYLDVEDSYGTNIYKLPCGSTCFNSGNNINWAFVTGVTVTTISGNTTETGGTATFSVALDLQPSADVSIPVTSSDTTEGTVAPSLLTFTNGNWNTPQTVTVTGVDDGFNDESITYSVVLGATTSADLSYNGINPADVTVINEDNDRGTGFIAPQQSTEENFVTILSPIAGQSLTSGGLASISWTSGGASLSNVNIFYSVDGGQSYVRLAQNLGQSGTYAWIVPDVDTDIAQVKIVGTDLVNDLVIAYSGFFSIKGTATITVPNPTAGVTSAYSPFTGASELVTEVNVGDFIKSPETSTVYYVDAGYIRRPFYDTQTYFTYNDSFNVIKIVTGATLPFLTLGNPMLPKSGVVLIKIQSSPKVYAVEGGVFLRFIPNEEIAAGLYGSAWADYVIDLSPTLFYHFVSGPDMSIHDTVDLAIMKRRLDLHE